MSSQEGKTGLCYLRGGGGIGKTQLALKFADESHPHYTHRIFIDCENEQRFKESLESVLTDLGKEVSDNWAVNLDRVKDFLSTSEKYLLLIDNIDSGDLWKKVQGLILERSHGDVLITGRLALPIPPIKVDRLAFESCNSLFRSLLVERYRDEFDKIDAKEREKFLYSELGGIPLAIKHAAAYFNAQSNSRNALYPISEYRQKILHKLSLQEMEWFTSHLGENNVELDYFKKIKDTYLPNIQLIEADFPREKAMVQDILRFLAFFGTLQNVPYPTSDSMQVLRDTFLKCTGNSLYANIDINQFERLFNAILNRFNSCSIIEISDNHPLTITVPQTVKWAVHYNFLENEVENFKKTVEKEASDYEKSCKEHSLSYRLYPFLGYELPAAVWEKTHQRAEAMKFAWFTGAGHYLNAIAHPDAFGSTYLSTLISLIDFINTFQPSDFFKENFIENLKIWNAVCQALTNNNPQLFEEIKKLPIDDLCTLITVQSKAVHAATKLGLLRCTQGDFEGAEKLFKIAQENNSTEVHFGFGLMHWHLGVKTTNPDEAAAHFKQALTHYNQQLEISKTGATYNNRGLCYIRLNEPAKAIEDYLEATRLDPFDPLYYRNLASAYAATGNLSNAQIYKTWDENIQFLKTQPEFKTLSSSDKKNILRYLNSNKTFYLGNPPITSESWVVALTFYLIPLFVPPPLSDGGALLGKMLNRNGSIKTIALEGREITSNGIAAIAQSLSSNTTIEELYLNNVLLTDQGIVALADGLKPNRTLKTLSIQNCPLVTPQSIPYLINAAPPQLEVIEIINCPTKTHEESLRDFARQKGIKIRFVPEKGDMYDQSS